MKHTIITLGRTYGSGGHKVGQIIADELHISYYDNELITLAAERGEINENLLAGQDEKRYNPFLYSAIYEGNQTVKKGKSASETLFLLQSQVIKEIAEREDAVIVGRCADFVLKDTDAAVISVFITAPFPNRIWRTRLFGGLNESEAISVTKKTDKSRKNYYEHYTGRKWAQKETYNLFFDSSTQGLNEIAACIIKEYQRVSASEKE